MHSELAERLALEHSPAWRVGMSNQFCFCITSPQINIATGRIDGVEALLRWNDPPGGTDVARTVSCPCWNRRG